MLGIQNVEDTFETRKRSFISAFSICMTVSLMLEVKFGDDTYNQFSFFCSSFSGRYSTLKNM